MDELTIEIFNKERQRYVDYFVETINILKRDKDTFASELLIKVNDQTIPEPFDLTRVDFIYKDQKDEDAIKELRLDKNLNYDNVELKLNDTKIIIKPFCWNSCEVTTDQFDSDELKKWIWKWIKVDGIINGHTSEAIHNCSLPETIGDRNKFIVDLGTSTRTALMELIDSLTKTGSKEISIETSVV